MEKMEEKKVKDVLREENIPIIEGEPDEVLEELNNVFQHWENVGLSLVKEMTEKHKVIISVLVPDFVAPYSNYGELVPVMIHCPEDPLIWKGLRFDIGMMEWWQEAGYKIIIFNSDFNGTISVEAFKKYHLEMIKGRRRM